MVSEMPFPISIRGHFTLHRQTESGDIRPPLIEAAADLLWKRSDDVQVEDNTVLSRPSFLAWFTAPGTNWHPMGPVDQVRLTIAGQDSEAVVAYELSTRRMLWTVTAMICGLTSFLVLTSFRHEGPVVALGSATKLAPVAFAWLFGANYLLGWWRAPRWLRRNLRKAAAKGR